MHSYSWYFALSWSLIFVWFIFPLREEQKAVLPVTCFSQPITGSFSNASCLPISTSVNVGSLILKSAHIMSEDKNDFLKPIANGKMVNSWKAFIFPACDHAVKAFTLAFYIYNIYYIMYIFFKKKIILGSSISCGLFDTSSPSCISILKR